MITVQKSFPIMPDLIMKLLKYFAPCTELSSRYSCKNWLAVSFLLCTTGWLLYNLIWACSNNPLSIFFEASIWFTVIFLTMCCLCCKVFIMSQTEKLAVFLKPFLTFTAYKIILHRIVRLIMLLLRCVALHCYLNRVDFIASRCVATIKHSVSRLTLNNLSYFAKLMKYRWQ